MQNLDILSTNWIIALCAVFLAALIRGFAGFGLALVLTPILLLFLIPTSVIAIVLLLAMVSNVYIIFRGYKNIDYRRILPMGIASLLGIPVGLWIITVIDPSIMKIVIGSIIIIFAIPITMGVQLSVRHELPSYGIAGFVSGVLVSSTGLGGPPAVIVMHAQNWSKEKMHPSIAAFFCFAGIFTILAYYLSGYMGLGTVITAATMIPVMLIGVVMGMAIFRRTNMRFYRYVSMIIIISAGIVGIISGVQSIY